MMILSNGKTYHTVTDLIFEFCNGKLTFNELHSLLDEMLTKYYTYDGDNRYGN